MALAAISYSVCARRNSTIQVTALENTVLSNRVLSLLPKRSKAIYVWLDERCDEVSLFKEFVALHNGLEIPLVTLNFIGDSTISDLGTLLQQQIEEWRKKTSSISHMQFFQNRYNAARLSVYAYKIIAEASVSFESHTILVIKGIIDPLYIMAARMVNKNWLTFLRIYCEYVNTLFTFIVATNADHPVIFAEPHIVDMGPKSGSEDHLGEQIVTMLDDYLSNITLDFNVRYINTKHILHEKILERGGFYLDNPHFAVINDIHFTSEGANVISCVIAKEGLSIMTDRKIFQQ